MEELNSLLQGFSSLLDPQIILWCIIGVTLGTLIGALPGLGAPTGIALLLPVTFSLDTISALLLLTGIYQGAMYGGRISAILINVPGDAPAAVTTFDGYPMTLQGKAGYALSLSAFASFIGGTIGFLGLIFLTPYVGEMALVFGAPEYFSLMLFALIVTGSVGTDNALKGIIIVGFGLLISLIGSDPIIGVERLTFGLINLWDGVNFIVVAIGIFGVSEVLFRIEERATKIDSFDEKIPFRDLFPTIKQFVANIWSIVRGGLLGFFVGVLPGAGATIAAFFSYSLEKKISRTPEKFGKGEDKGLSSPESANNAAVGGALVPLFSLGIPGSSATAVMLGALIMYGLKPGPSMLETSGDIIWPVIAGLLVANLLLLIINTAFIPVFTFLIMKAQPYLIPIITVLCFIGVYFLNYSYFDIGIMIVFGIFGYLLRKFGFSLATLILAIVLGEMIETNFRQALLISQNNFDIFISRPISLFFLIFTMIVILYPVIINTFIKKTRKS